MLLLSFEDENATIIGLMSTLGMLKTYKIETFENIQEVMNMSV